MAKKKNPLSDSPRKKRSYVGDFDELMADISEEEDSRSDAEEETPSGEDNPGSGKDSPARTAEKYPKASDKPGNSEPTASMSSPKEEKAEDAETPKKPLNLKIDESLHTRFKGVVGMQGRTMTEVLEEFMRDYVQRSLQDLDL